MLVPDSDGPVVEGSRLKAALWIAEDVALLIAFDAAGIKADGFLALTVFALGHDQTVCRLYGMLIRHAELPEDAKLVDIDADGFAEAVDTA
jgi:hypothetical protein